MAMVGLFWITEEFVYVGAEPVGYGRGVRLTAEGIEAVGADQGGAWAWADVRAVTVHDVKVRSAVRALVGHVLDGVTTAVTGDYEPPGAFEVHVETADEKAELAVYAAVGGYVASEYELSLALLERLVAAPADVSALLDWGRVHAAAGTLRREEREALLRTWAAAAATGS